MRKSILFVHHRSELGGAPTSLSYLISHLDKAKFDPHVFCPPGAAEELFREAGATVHTGPVAAFTHIWASTYSGRRWLLFARELLRLPEHVAAFERTLRAHRFALVHLNDSPLVLAAVMARRRGIPVVWHLRSALPPGGGIRARLLSLLIKRMSREVIAINSDVAESFGLHAEVVPNSVDLELFKPGERAAARRQLGIADEIPLVTFFGFIYPAKGFREFIEAAARIQANGIDARYLIVGGAVRGEEFFRKLVGRTAVLAGLAVNHEREANELVDELRLGRSVSFIPFTTDTADLYRASDVVVAPSRGRELGRPVIEAAASGVPIVASGSQTGAGVVIPDETGVLTATSDSVALASAISALLRDDERRERLGIAARVHAEKTFDPRRNARRITEIYERIVGPAGRIRILFVHHRPQLGGAPTSLAQLIGNLDGRFEPHVFTPAGPSANLFVEAGAKVHAGPVAIFAHPWDSPYEGMRWLILLREVTSLFPHRRALKAVLKDGGFDIVHLNDSPLLPAAQLAHRRAKVVWHLRSALAHGGTDARSVAIRRLMDRWGDAAIAIDEDVARHFPLRIPSTIVYNAVERRPGPESAEAKAVLGLPPNRVAVGFAGFIRRQKGWPELVRAARLVVDEEPKVHFVIIGGGVRSQDYFRTTRGRVLAGLQLLTDDETAMRDLVDQMELAEHFSFLPFTSDTSTAYRAVDIVTFPNQGVGLGRPVLEAAAYGKPVVASGSLEGGGVLIPDETGLLLQDPTPRAVAESILRLVHDGALRERLGNAAAEHAREAFDPAQNARLVQHLYDELLGIPPASVAEVTRDAAAVAG